MTDFPTSPREEFATKVVYGPWVLELTAGVQRDLAEKRRDDHLACGATEAEVYRRVWTATDWERVS